jgi:Acetyltransferase (GNAT) domain
MFDLGVTSERNASTLVRAPDVAAPVSEPRGGGIAATTAERWDAFVRGHPRGTAHHLSAWAEILRRAYGFEPVYLALNDESGELRGVMPLVRGNGLISPPRLVSLPVMRWGGPLGVTFDDEAVLMQAACRIAKAEGASYLGVRSEVSGYEDVVDDLAVRPTWPSWRVSLPADWEAFHDRVKQCSKNTFRSLRKADSPNLQSRVAESEQDLRRFYGLYLRVMRKHRSLPRRYRQFELSRRLLSPAGVFKLLVVERAGRQVAGGIFHFFGEMVETVYQASDDRYLDLRPNHALYGNAIRTAIESGYRFFDFGAAEPGTSLELFKKGWSTDPVERFHYTCHGDGGRSSIDKSMRSAMRAGTRRDSVRNLALRKAPLPLGRMAGALVYRYL